MTPPRRFVTDPEVPLTGAVDAEARFARIPPHYAIKGLFFPRLVATLGDAWPEHQHALLAPPRLGRYLPFMDYPQVDYSRLTVAVEQKLYPALPLPEAARRLARNDFTDFARSTVGSVALSLASGLDAALLRCPEMYAMVLRGGVVRAERERDGVRLDFVDFVGWVDCYPIGTIEGLVMRFGRVPRIEVDLFADDRASYHVRWT